jgi:hypothetical protein
MQHPVASAEHNVNTLSPIVDGLCCVLKLQALVAYYRHLSYRSRQLVPSSAGGRNINYVWPRPVLWLLRSLGQSTLPGRSHSGKTALIVALPHNK